MLIGFAVADEFLVGSVEPQFPALAIGDVAQVAERRRQVTIFNIGIQFHLFTRTQNFNEVLEVVLISGSGGIRRISGVFSIHGWPRFVFPAEISLPVGAVQVHPPFRSIKEIAYLDLVFAVGVQTAHFKLNDFAVAIFKRGVLHVGGFLIVVESKLSAAAKNFLGIFRF